MTDIDQEIKNILKQAKELIENFDKSTIVETQNEEELEVIHLPRNLPAGEYFVGDPCYAFDHKIPEHDNMWMKYCDHIDEGALRLNGVYIASESTLYGDGEYEGFSVDAGVLGAVSIAHCTEEQKKDFVQLGRIVVFPEPFEVSSDGDGTINIGHISIFTGDYEDDEDDYDEDDG